MSWTLDDLYTGAFQPFYHPGTVLFLGLVLGAASMRQTGMVIDALAAALRRLVPVALALLVMLALSRSMIHAGLIDVLATAVRRP